MGQLISLYNHPDYSRRNLTKLQFEHLESLWHKEDEINRKNGVEIFDTQALEQRIYERSIG